MYKSIHRFLSEIAELKTTKEKVDALVNHPHSQAFKIIFAYAFDPNIKWLLPEGNAPYKPTDMLDVEGRLLHELRRLYLFVEGGHPNLTKNRREALFIQMLESVDPKDAILLNSIKDKKIPFKGLNKKIVQQAFPDINIEEGKE